MFYWQMGSGNLPYFQGSRGRVVAGPEVLQGRYHHKGQPLRPSRGVVPGADGSRDQSLLGSGPGTTPEEGVVACADQVSKGQSSNERMEMVPGCCFELICF